MLNSGRKKNCALCDKKNKNSNSQQKNMSPPPPPPPCKLNGRSLNVFISETLSQHDDTFSSSLCHSHYNKFFNNSVQCIVCEKNSRSNDIIWFLKL